MVVMLKTSMGLNLADRKEFKKMAERDKPAVNRMLEEKPKRTRLKVLFIQ
jgi:hypothetical protein